MTTERELTESELASVSGGTLSLNYGTIEYEYGHQSSGSGGESASGEALVQWRVMPLAWMEKRS
jgi:bacteriocin-like protein